MGWDNLALTDDKKRSLLQKYVLLPENKEQN